jgi:hypothetical protein
MLPEPGYIEVLRAVVAEVGADKLIEWDRWL